MQRYPALKRWANLFRAYGARFDPLLCNAMKEINPLRHTPAG